MLEDLLRLAPAELHEQARGARHRLADSEWWLGNCLLAVERSGMHREHECSSAVQYAVRHLQLDGQKASELLRAARALEVLPGFDEAYRRGELPWAKIRAVTRVACQANEAEWLEFARAHSCEEIDRHVMMTPSAAGARPKLRGPGGCSMRRRWYLAGRVPGARG